MANQDLLKTMKRDASHCEAEVKEWSLIQEDPQGWLLHRASMYKLLIDEETCEVIDTNELTTPEERFAPEKNSKKLAKMATKVIADNRAKLAKLRQEIKEYSQTLSGLQGQTDEQEMEDLDELLRKHCPGIVGRDLSDLDRDEVSGMFIAILETGKLVGIDPEVGCRHTARKLEQAGWAADRVRQIRDTASLWCFAQAWK